MVEALKTTELGDAGSRRATVASAGLRLAAGAVLGERYRLVRPLASGGMGSVWEGVHTTLGTPVAVKLINAELGGDERARARFVREAQLAASLRSPHVIQIFDYGLEGDIPYIAMELLTGESLATRLARARALSPAETGRLMRDVFRAVAVAHEAGLVHRDLKPDNIFIVDGPDGEFAKVLDFGVAKRDPGGRLDSTTETGAMLGTPLYMSPEQLMDAGAVDVRSDLWSLAVIVYECLVGARPFAAESVASLAVALCTTTPPVPSTSARVPPGFDEWFARATQREPDARFPDALEMLAALERALVGAARDGDATPPARDAARRRWPLVVLVIAVALAAASALALRPRRDAEPDSPPRADPGREAPTIPAAQVVASPDDAPSAPRPRAEEPTDRERAPPSAEEADAAEPVPQDINEPTAGERATAPAPRRRARPTKAKPPEPRPGFDVDELEF